jgi:hypothetical protein
MAAFLYMCFIYYVLKLIGKINRSVLTLNKPYWAYSIANGISSVLSLIVLSLSLWGLRSILQSYEITGTFSRILFNGSIHLLIQLGGFSSLSFLYSYSCVFLIVFVPTIVLSAIASPVKIPLWGIVLFFYALGGILLIINANL